ncbi:MAG: sensor domain-containing diguanylate cyclase, partial [Betaproteobacteria bacterium]
GAIKSVALLPLARHGELIGSLHFGSADPERYVSDCRTDFLVRLAEIVAICLESALSQERLKLVGLTDALTGVQNRRYFEHRCPVEISQARRYKHALACMFLDIDKFKRINDTYGHQTGDDVLRSVANIIQAQLRSGDTISRYGGEEFVVLLPQSELHHALQIAERIRSSIEEQHLQAASGQVIKMTISIGLSMLSAKNLAEESHQAATGLIAAADKALYQAKHNGRNRVEWDGRLSSDRGRRMSYHLIVWVQGLPQWTSRSVTRLLKRLPRAKRPGVPKK